MPDAPKVALVTGANKGIGREIARQLGNAGVHVIIGARDPSLGSSTAAELAASGIVVEALLLDLSNEASIMAAADQISAKHGKLDILVNNAGTADDSDGPPSAAPIATVRRILETNFVGALAVTQAMLPLLRKSAAGRIVNLASPLGSMAVNNDPSSPYYAYRLIGYGASKAALNMLTLQLHGELQGSSIAVNSVVPGFVQTDLTHQQGNMTPEEGAKLPVKYALLEDDTVSGHFVEPDGEMAW